MGIGPIDASASIQAGHTSSTTQNLQGATVNSGINFAPQIGNSVDTGASSLAKSKWFFGLAIGAAVLFVAAIFRRISA